MGVTLPLDAQRGWGYGAAFVKVLETVRALGVLTALLAVATLFPNGVVKRVRKGLPPHTRRRAIRLSTGNNTKVTPKSNAPTTMNDTASPNPSDKKPINGGPMKNPA